jgi:ElaB/YqjD/DUF883 family membrane-anchored ribosome-binding protein
MGKRDDVDAMRSRIDALLGDPQKLVESMERAMENTGRQIEARQAQIEANAQKLQAETQALVGSKGYKVIAIDGRVGRRPARLYITTVSFRPGDGWAVSKIGYSADRAKAKELSTGAAMGVSEYLVRCGYTPHVENK